MTGPSPRGRGDKDGEWGAGDGGEESAFDVDFLNGDEDPRAEAEVGVGREVVMVGFRVQNKER